ncbi:MAG: prepilin-type N-terminal cleavage/methylation domain-containing protein, partial [Campylobacterota bacterium]|nr:prepilin-type N-terminal cleavage/methylation domain-containing protein [Campylobacterota bacterium]
MKKAFSLIELMIVIVIIGVIYTIAVSKLQTVGEEKVSPSFLNLKEYLGSFIKDDVKSARLLCLDDCSDCDIYADGEKVKTIESFFDESVEVYRYDVLQGLVEKKKPVFFNEEDVQESVCFSFEVYKNSVAEQLIVSFEERAYDYTSYFEKTPRYDSLEDLVE